MSFGALDEQERSNSVFNIAHWFKEDELKKRLKIYFVLYGDCMKYNILCGSRKI